jgi:hypothetical protein
MRALELLLLGYGALTKAEIHTGVERLAAALRRQLCLGST